MINTTVMRAGRNTLVGALLCTFGALAVGTIASSSPAELRAAALAAATTQSGSAYALTPGVIDQLSAGAPATGPVRMVGHIVDTGATDLGGPNGVFLQAVRNAGGTVTDAPKTMQIGKRVVLDLRKGADGSAVIATAQASLDAGGAASGVDGGTLARAAVGVYAPELASALPAALSAQDQAFLAQLTATWPSVVIGDQAAVLDAVHAAMTDYQATGDRNAATATLTAQLDAHPGALSTSDGTGLPLRGITGAAIAIYAA